MNFINLFKTEIMHFSSEIHYLFCAEGDFEVNEMSLHEGDTLKSSNEKEIKIVLKSENLKLIQIAIDRRSGSNSPSS